jgi:uncharacterized integral membrane protein
MPALGWRFKKRTPLWFMLVVGLLLANSALHFALLFTVSSWAQPRPDLAHSYRVPFRDGVIYFVQPWLGEYLNAWWVGLGLLVLLIVLLIQNRHQLERTE